MRSGSVEMMHDSKCNAAAIRVMEESISSRSCFPHSVFSGHWSRYLFFDSDWLFETTFIETTKNIIRTEGAKCAAIVKFSESQADEDVFFVSDDTDPDEYRVRLSGYNEATGWIYDFGRFAVTSEIGTWCVYCERRSEIGVIGFRQLRDEVLLLPQIAHFKPATVWDAISSQSIYGLSEQGASHKWRSELLKNYSTLST